MVRILTVAALSSLASFATSLSVLSPGGDQLWWVAQSDNVLVWDCNHSDEQVFTVLINNTDVTVLTAPLAIIAEQQNTVCSLLVTQQQMTMPAHTGYTVILANPLNNTDVYATSEQFEIKALGAAYPSTTVAVPAAGSATASASAGASGTATGSASQSSSTSGSNDAVTVRTSVGMGLVAVGALLGIAF